MPLSNEPCITYSITVFTLLANDKNSKNQIQGQKECITGWSLKIAVYKTFMGLTSGTYGFQILLTSAFIRHRKRLL